LSANSAEKEASARATIKKLKAYVGKFAIKGISGCTADENVMRVKLIAILSLLKSEVKEFRKETGYYSTEYETANEEESGDEQFATSSADAGSGSGLPTTTKAANTEAGSGGGSNATKAASAERANTDSDGWEDFEPTAEELAGQWESEWESLSNLSSRTRNSRKGSVSSGIGTNAIQKPDLGYSIVGCCKYLRPTYERVCREALPSFSGDRLHIDSLLDQMVKQCSPKEACKHAERIVGAAHPFCTTSTCDHEIVLYDLGRYIGKFRDTELAATSNSSLDNAKNKHVTGLAANRKGRHPKTPVDGLVKPVRHVAFEPLVVAKDRSSKTGGNKGSSKKIVRNGGGKSSVSGSVHKPNPVYPTINKELRTPDDGGRKMFCRPNPGTEEGYTYICTNVGNGTQPRRGESIEGDAVKEHVDERDVQLHQKRIHKLVGPLVRDGTTLLTGDNLAKASGGLQSPRDAAAEEGSEGWQTPRYRRPTKRVLRQEQATVVDSKPGQQVLGSGNAPNLQSQRGKGPPKPRVHGDTRNGSRNARYVGDCGGRFCTAGAGKPCWQSRRSNRHVPTKSEENVSEMPGKRQELRGGNSQSSQDFSIRQVRKAQDRGKGWGSTINTSKIQGIQSVARPVHPANRKEPLRFKGSHVDVERHIAKLTSEREELVSKSGDALGGLGKPQESRKSELGPVKVGRPRKGGATTSYASVLSQSDTGSVPKVAATAAAKEQGNDTEPSKVLKHRRGHQWRYDDSTGELCCSKCDFGKSSRFAATLCRKNRRDQIRREDKASRLLLEKISDVRQTGPNKKDRTKVPPYGAFKEEIPGDSSVLNGNRRGRSCNDNVGGMARDANGDPTNLVGNGRPCAQGGGGDKQVPPDRVLSTQTLPLVEQPLGDDTKPVESSGNSDSSSREQPAEVGQVLDDSVGGKIETTPGSTDSGSFVQEVVKHELDERSTESRTIETVSVGNRPPNDYQQPQQQGIPYNSPGTTGDVRGTVGGKSTRTDALGTNENDETEEIRIPSDISEDEQEVAENDCVMVKPMVALYEGDASVPQFKHTAIVHCVGADFTLGKGFAKLLVDKYGRPTLKHPPYRPTRMGDVVAQKITDDLWIMHMVVKEKSAIPGRKQQTYRLYLQALVEALNRIYKFTPMNVELQIPYLIGCGLDGMPEEDILKVLSELGVQYQRYINVFRL